MEYLEDKFPEPPLLPGGPEAKARVRLLQRIGEHPAQRDPIASVWLTRLVRGLSSVQIYVGDEQFAAGPQLTLADCELASALFMLPKIVAAFGKPDLLQAYPPIGRYVASSNQHPAIHRVLTEMAPAWGLRELAR
jgi:glutathione S-transferase